MEGPDGPEERAIEREINHELHKQRAIEKKIEHDINKEINRELRHHGDVNPAGNDQFSLLWSKLLLFLNFDKAKIVQIAQIFAHFYM